MFGTMGQAPPAYAIMNDKELHEVDYYRQHEGLQLLTWHTDNYRDWTGVEAYLLGINLATNPVLK